MSDALWSGQSMLERREFLALAGAAAAGTLARPVAGEQVVGTTRRRPNIVVIVADDLGYGDVCGYSCHGLKTPNIDSISTHGVRFTDGHVTAPVCSPSRAGFITGRYQQRFGHEFNAGGMARCDKEGLGLPTSETTVADAMRAAGYATGMIGKSHLGSQPQFHPLRRGFDEFFGFLHGANLYLEPLDAPGVHWLQASDEAYPKQRAKINPILRGTEQVEEEAYLTDAFAREAVSFIDRRGEKPFFLYVPFNAPHTPLQVTDAYYQRFAHIPDERHRIYAAMVSALDDGVGRILEALKRNDLWHDTMVVFFSDNGCATYTSACYNDPLLGGKLTLFEGGQRIPFAVQYPGVLPAGVEYEGTVSSLDIFPTAVNLAGGSVPSGRDGVDWMPYLTGARQGSPDRPLFWRHGTNSAVRQGPWKLVNLGTGRYVLLYNVEEDVGETTDLAARHPDRVKELSAVLADWNAQLVAPLWPSRKVIPFRQDGIEFDLFV